MQIGISTFGKIFQKEQKTLDPLTDYYEAILTNGPSELSSYAGSEVKIKVAHLIGLDNECLDSLENANRLKIDKAIIHFHTVTPMDFNAKLDVLDHLSRRASDNDIILCLENTEENPETLTKIFKRLPELKFCLDIGHANIVSNNPVHFIEVFNNRLEHIHIHDNNGGTSEIDDLHLPIGEGNIDFHRIFSKLVRIGYDEYVTLELHPRFDIEIKVDNLIQLRSLVRG